MQHLLIKVRIHGHRFHGLDTNRKPEWPPSPARFFQALVAAASQGAVINERDRAALEWLERLDPPLVAAPAAHKGQQFSHFMPNNDLDTVAGDPSRIAKVRTATKHFHPQILDSDSHLIYLWSFDESSDLARAVADIVNRLYQLGRGVDMAWAESEILESDQASQRISAHTGAIYRPSENGGGRALACPVSGSLTSLSIRFDAMRARFQSTIAPGSNKAVQTFSQPPKPRFRQILYNSPPTALLYELRELTPESSFFSWRLERVAELVILIRDMAAKRLEDALPTHAAVIKRVFGLSREATEADKASRIRVVPLPSIGHQYADPSIRRILVIVPPNCPLSKRDIAWAFSSVEPVDIETGEINWTLVPAEETRMLDHYGMGNDGQLGFRRWHTITPVALPVRSVQRGGDSNRRIGAHAQTGSERRNQVEHAAAAVAQALRHAGVDAPVQSIRVQREPFAAKGAPADRFALGTRFAAERLWHVEIDFSDAVLGPLGIGDGRYLGLGLMHPVRRMEGVIAFTIQKGLSSTAQPMELARALRRAVMARVQDQLGARVPLPEFFSGHASNGDPLRNGAHEHLAFVADLARGRLLIILPHLLESRVPTGDETRYLQTLDKAIAGLSQLRAAACGLVQLARTRIDTERDPLFAPSQSWESQSEYLPTRHAKRFDAREAVERDLMREASRRGWPLPRIEVIECREGPRGGLSARLRLFFQALQPGPILVGRNCHFGGGLFQGASMNED